MSASFRNTAIAALGFASSAFALGNGGQNQTCPAPDKTCQSFGVDFLSGHNYFQNSDFTTDFNISTTFSGCQPDIAYNNLILPSGQQIICSNVTLTPDGSIETSTCPLAQSDMVSGEYSLLILSNNGPCPGIAAQRHFSISVGQQQTTTVTPGVTFTSTSTPVSIATITSTITSEFYLPPATVTETLSIKGNATKVVTPRRVIETITTTKATKYLTKYDLLVANSLVTKTAHCKITDTAPPSADPTAETSATTGAVVTAITSKAPFNNGTAEATPTPSAYARREVHELLSDITGDIDAFLARRHESLNRIAKRAPEEATSTVIITDVNRFSYSTITKTAKTFTTTFTELATLMTTSTPEASTLYLNPKTVITAPTPTLTRTRTIKFVTSWVSATKYQTVKIKTTVTPSEKAAKCTAKGGFMQ